MSDKLSSKPMLCRLGIHLYTREVWSHPRCEFTIKACRCGKECYW